MLRPYVVDSTLGAEFVGLLVSTALFGVSLVQAWYYYTHQNDSWPIKLFVAAVMIVDTIHQMLISHTVYTYNITNWGNPAILPSIVWSMTIQNIFNALTGFLVQSFMTRRVWRLSHGHKLLTGVVALLVLAEFVSVVVFVAIELQLKTYGALTELKYLSISVNALAAAGDLLIAASLCTLLHFSRTGLHRTDTIIDRLILFAVNTGLLTSLCALGSLITMFAVGNTSIYIAFYFCMGSLYTNSLLATLNARKKIRSLGSAARSTNIPLSLGDFSTAPSTGKRQPTNISIKVDTTQEFATDKKEYTTGDLEKAETVSSSTRVERKETESV